MEQISKEFRVEVTLQSLCNQRPSVSSFIIPLLVQSVALFMENLGRSRFSALARATQPIRETGTGKRIMEARSGTICAS